MTAAAGAAFQIDSTQNFNINLQQNTGSFATSLFGFMIQSAGGVTETIQGNITGTTQSGLATTIRTGGGALDINQLAGTISGSTIGITTQNNGNSFTKITTAGTVTSPGPGMGIVNTASATDLSIIQLAGLVSGGSVGITSNNQGTGASLIETSGAVKSTAGPAFSIANQSTAKGLTVTQHSSGDIDANTGISATNFGSGNTTISTSGVVKANNGAGVTVAHDGTSAPATLSVSLLAGSITSTSAGISTRNQSGGPTNITTNANILSTGGVAINADHRVAGDLNITQQTGDITGHVTGIGANNLGTGAIVVNVNGTVKATGPAGSASGVGVFATSNNPAGGKVTLNQALGTSISGTNWGVGLNQFGPQPIEFNAQGTIIGGVGGGVYTASANPPGSPVIFNAMSGANISSTGTDNIAIRDGGGQAQLTLFGGSTVNGHVRLGSNSDRMLVKSGAVISTNTVIDGGSSFAGVDLITDTANTNTNKLTFEQTQVTRPGATLLNWQTITLDATPTELTDSTLHVGTGTNPDGTLQGLLLRNGSVVTLAPVVQFIGDVSIAPGTQYLHLAGGTVQGKVTNDGIIDWRHPGSPPPAYTDLKVSSYASSSGALIMNTSLGLDSAPSDTLTIDGGTGTGTTSLRIANTDGLGALTTGNGILVVHAINGATTTPGAFALAERLFAGGYEYKLYRGSVDASSPDSWYLRTEKVVTPPGNVAPVPGLGGIMQLALAALIAAFAWRKRRVSVTKGLGLFASK